MMTVKPKLPDNTTPESPRMPPHERGPAHESLVARTEHILDQIRTALHALWWSARARAWRGQMASWRGRRDAGLIVLLGGTALCTLLIAAVDWLIVPLPNPGVVYLPLVAMLAYHWSWRHGAAAALLQLICVSLLFVTPGQIPSTLNLRADAELITLAAVDAFILAIVQLARNRRDAAEREATRTAALNAIGIALASELEEGPLLTRIAHTARDLTGAGFAAFTLRPVDELGHPTGLPEGSLFHLAAVVGVTPEQEAGFRRVPLGGEGLLAPIFRFGKPVRVADALAMTHATRMPAGESKRDIARHKAADYAQGHIPSAELQTVGMPRSHPVVRSFLGAPLLDRTGQVLGGLLLGHDEPDQFTAEDETLLLGLAAEAAVALENARLFRAAQTQTQELDAIFDGITDGVALVDTAGRIRRENRAATALRRALAGDASGANTLDDLARAAAAHAHPGEYIANTITLGGNPAEARVYVVTAAPLRPVSTPSAGPTDAAAPASADRSAGAVVVWHDVTETRRLLIERQARAEAEGRRALLQLVIDELPSAVYLVRGPDARLVLTNRAAMDVWGAVWAPDQPMRAFLTASGVRVLATNGRPLPESELATLRTVRTGEAVYHHEEIIRRPDGTALPILLNAVALDPALLQTPSIAEASGNGASPEVPQRAALVVLQDVTALKETERLKDEFIAIAAHELKTPMTAVKGYAETLRKRNPEGGAASALGKWQIEALETIDQATTRLVELTDDLLDVARLQSGRMELHPEPHDLVALARRIARRLQITTDQHTFVVQAESDFVVACLDIRRVEQVLSNLLSNAIKYSPRGGPITITISEDATHRLAQVAVHDTGIGIPSDQQARLFGRFERAANARELGIKGTGLGLYLCRELIERHGGRIWFESIEGRGSTFHFTLPLASE